jgi:NTE family protein
MSSHMRRAIKQMRGLDGFPMLFLAACLFPLSGPAAAEEPSSTAVARPRIGLALSGGGARGAAHVGVLKVLEEHRIPVDYIAGTSMGAIVGGLYASGMSPAELETMICHTDWTAAFADLIPRRDRSFRRKRDDDLYLIKNKPGISGRRLLFPPGLLDGQKIDLLLKRYTLPVIGIRDFDELGIPFRAVAADLVTGEPVVIDHGDLALALRASMSIPVVFAPREIDGRLLVDGGIGSNLPIEVVRRMGADIVIAVDISTPLQEQGQLRSVLAITDQITTIMTRRDTDRQIASLHSGDVFIRPALGDITTASFDRSAEAIPAGVNAAEAALGELVHLSVSADEYREYSAGRTARCAPPVVEELRIVNRSRLADGVISARLHVEIGEPLDVDRLEKDLDQIFGLELFESVYYDLSADSGRMVLTVTARERSWGPNYLQFGVAIFEDFEGPNFNLAAAYTRTAINRLNGEWRVGVQIGQEPSVFTELYQPLDKSLHYFLQLQATLTDRADNTFDAEGNKISELGLLSYGVEIAGGRDLGTWGEIRGGVLREAGTIAVQVGARGTPKVDFNTGEPFLQFSIDERDNANFPRSGGELRMRLAAGLEDLGSDVHYEQGMIEGSCAASLGRWTGLLEGLFAATRASDAPYQRLFRLGGFARLSGLEQNELGGQHAALLSTLLYRRIGDFSLLSLYAGLSLEYGNVFQERADIAFEKGKVAGSAFLGLDTLVGPLYLAYGVAERGRANFYLFLGKRL